MTTTQSNITQDMTPIEAANLLAKLEEGHQAAWLATHDLPWHSAEYQSRFQNAAEIDGLFRDTMWQTVENGMRRPEPPADPIVQRADPGTTPERVRDSQDQIATRLLNDASTPEGRAYAKALSDTAATYVRELRERDPLPEPDRTPGAPHPDQFLAGRGWHMNEHGIYTRRVQPEAQAPPERELEAGS